MIALAYSIAGFVLAIAVLVIVHEFGHYWVARRLGVKVLRFSVGFGKVLWSRQAGKDATEYVIAAVPLGGYVKMLDETEGEVAIHERHRSFNRQPVYKRAAIVAAGPLFNFLFAFAAYWLVLILGVPGVVPVVGKVVPGSVAAKAGFRAGDVMLRIDGKRVLSWDQHRLLMLQEALQHDTVQIEVRNGQGRIRIRKLNFKGISAQDISSGRFDRTIGLYGYLPKVQPVIGRVMQHDPAYTAGLRAGDRVVAVDGQHIHSWQALVRAVSAAPGRPLDLAVERDGTRRVVRVTPKPVHVGGRVIGRIGAVVRFPSLPPQLRTTVRLGPIAALGGAWENTWAMSALTVEMLYKMALLRVSAKYISGPITIAQYAGYSVQLGLASFLTFLAVVSVSLGVLNLMPVPVLDGGHLLFYVVEVFKGSPVSERVVGWGQRAGILLLLGLMVLAFYNDFVRILQ
ncbi:MAG: RIP metalloprotease RseP [Acidiferrobacteraceae bacterium]